MKTILYSHPSCIEHDAGEYHPERPDRLRAVLDGLSAEEFQYLPHVQAEEVGLDAVRLVHHSQYVEQVLDSVPESGHVQLDGDTALNPASGEAALRATGAALQAVDAVMEKQADNAFCAVRPPGHHAESGAAMGFCLFNSAAIAGFHLRTKHKLDRVAVIDFDVHHGNGTQHSFERVPGMFYGSSHQWPAYPGTGTEEETGEYNNICNVGLAPGDGSEAFRAAYTDTILPALRAFNPEFLIISAGFDAHARDPLAQLRVQTRDYEWLTCELLDVADDCCDGRAVSLLEGGYDLQALRDSTTVHVRAMMDR